MFVSEQHPTSRRFAVFEEDETTAYLYLTNLGATHTLKFKRRSWADDGL